MTQSVQNFDNRNIGYEMQQQRTPQHRRSQSQAVRIPDYYVDNDKQSFKEIFEESPLYSVVIKGFFGPLIDHPLASVLTWFGCGFLLNKYDSACGGNYENSLLKKVANFGDNLENSKFIQSKPIQNVLGLFKSGSNKAGNILSKSSVFRAIKNTPTMPEWEMVKSEMMSQRQRVVHDFNQIVNELKLGSDDFAELHKLDLDKNDKEAIKKFFNITKLSDIPEEKASSFIQLKRLGKDDKFIKKAISMPDSGVSSTKAEILKAMGNKDVNWLKAVREDTIGKYTSEVQDAAKSVGRKVRVSLGNYKPLGINLGFLTTPTKRTLGCDSVYNRLFSLQQGAKAGAKTSTGVFMSKAMQMTHRALTFGGGKLGILLFIAPALVETVLNMKKAEPGQKVSTGVNNLTNHISWVFTFPFALQIMHHLFGAQYAGMTKENVQKIRALQANFNKKNNLNGTEKGFSDYEAYNKERKKVNKQIKDLKVVEGQKWYTKAIRKFAGMLTPDLGKLDAYNTGNIVTRQFSKLRNLPRNMFGVPARLILFGVLTMGVLDGAINKCIKLLFGDFYDSMKDEEQKDSKKEQKKFLKEDLNDRLYQTQKEKIAQMALGKNKNPQFINNISYRGCNNVHENPQHKDQNNQKLDNYTYIPSQENVIKQSDSINKLDNYTYIPSQDSTILNDENGNANPNKIRTYIPSQDAANITKQWDNSGLQSALDRAQRAEDRALKILAGNFEGM